MDFKSTIIFVLLILLSLTMAQAQAAYSCRKPICCASPASTMHSYVDIGLGKALYTRFHSPVNKFIFDDEGQEGNLIFSLSPHEKFYKNNLFMEFGLSWSQPFFKNSPYFPFVNMGLRYQVNNLNEQITPMGLYVSTNIVKSDAQNEIRKIFSLNNSQEFIFSQNNLLVTFKLNLYRWGCLMPYINGGFGSTWHQVIQKDALDKQMSNTTIFKYLADYKKIRILCIMQAWELIF